MLVQKSHLGIPQSWLSPRPELADVEIVPRAMVEADETKRLRYHLQKYVNGCTHDADIFDFGKTYGCIDRGKGVQARELLTLSSLIDELLQMYPNAKTVKGELQNAINDILAQNPRRAILTARSKSDAVDYVTAQVQRSLHPTRPTR